MDENAQSFGVAAVGALVKKEFADGRTYSGTITKFVKATKEEPELYHVLYEDGDEEDWDREEYNYGYALHLRDEGWNVEELGDGSATDGSDGGDPKDIWRPSKVICFCARFLSHFHSAIQRHFFIEILMYRLQHSLLCTPVVLG